MAYTPDDLRAVEQLVADNRAAKEEGERVAAERARQEAQRQRETERAQLAAQQATEPARRQQVAACRVSKRTCDDSGTREW